MLCCTLHMTNKTKRPRGCYTGQSDHLEEADVATQKADLHTGAFWDTHAEEWNKQKKKRKTFLISREFVDRLETRYVRKYW